MKVKTVLLIFIFSSFCCCSLSAGKFTTALEAGTAISHRKNAFANPSFITTIFKYGVCSHFTVLAPIAAEYNEIENVALTLGLGAEFRCYTFKSQGYFSLVLKGGSSIFNNSSKSIFGNYSYADLALHTHIAQGGYLGVGVKRLMGHKTKTIDELGFMPYLSVGFNF